MAARNSILSALNATSLQGVQKSVSARNRPKDILLKDIYPNPDNFYPQEEIEQKVSEILLNGLIQNLVVTHAPCERGEYKLIDGERRYHALEILVERGYSEFERVTCNVKTFENQHEEMIQLIMANSSRQKDPVTLMKEAQQIKTELHYMRDNGIKLNGHDLSEGRLRDVVADILGVSKTKVAEMESISNRLIAFWKNKLELSVISVSVAYQISKLCAGDQYRLWQELPNKDKVTLADIADFVDRNKKIEVDAPTPIAQKQDETVEHIEHLPGQMKVTEDGDCVDEPRETNQQSDVSSDALSTNDTQIVDGEDESDTELLTTPDLDENTAKNEYEYVPTVEPKKEVVGTVIDELELSVRTYNVLVRGGVRTIEQLEDMYDSEILAFHHSSDKTVDEVHSALKKYRSCDTEDRSDNELSIKEQLGLCEELIEKEKYLLREMKKELGSREKISKRKASHELMLEGLKCVKHRLEAADE